MTAATAADDKPKPRASRAPRAAAARGGRTSARSTKVRPAEPAAPDAPPAEPIITSTGRSFPPPTPWSEQMAIDNQRLAINRARRIATRYRYPKEELLPAAWVGLLKACRYYDPNRLVEGTGKPHRFSTCAVPFIDGAIKQYLRDAGYALKLPHAWREIGPRVRRLAGEGKTAAEIAAETGMSADEVRELLQVTGQAKPLQELRELEAPTAPAGAPEEDEATEDLELADLYDLAARAWLRLEPADQRLILTGWAARRRYVPTLPLGQFRVHVRKLTGPFQTPPAPAEAAPLGFEVAKGQRRPAEAHRAALHTAEDAASVLTETAEQLGLFAMLA